MQADITVNNNQYCTAAAIGYWEGVQGGSDLVQAGWEEGVGIGGPHAFDEFIYANGGEDSGPIIHQALGIGNYAFYSGLRATGVQGKGQGTGSLNGSTLDNWPIDWTWGSAADPQGESYSTYNQWYAELSNNLYCTSTGLSYCGPTVGVHLSPYNTGDPNACENQSGLLETLYDKRWNGGHC